MNQLTFGSLFAGIGGFDLGFERSGMKCLWQVEKDEFCRKVLAKHWPDVPKYEDVKDCGKHNLEPVDVVCGGFPCQPHSFAGNRRGAEDDRHLWPQMCRIIDELKPTWVVGENVPGIVSTILDEVLTDLESLNYEIATCDIPACGVNAPHRRHRIFIIANCKSNGRQQRNTDTARSSARMEPRQEQRFEHVCSSLAYADSKQAHKQRSGCGEFSQQSRRSMATRSKAIRQKDGETSHNDDSGFCQVLSHSNGQRQQKQRSAEPAQAKYETVECGGQWEIEPGICRVVDGFPGRVDRLRGLGNAVVPQIATFLGVHIQRANNNHLQLDPNPRGRVGSLN